MTHDSNTAQSLGRSALLGAALLAIPTMGYAGTIYAVSQVFGDVYTIDATTGSATLVGNVSETSFHGIAFDGGGVLYGVKIDFSVGLRLWELDPDAGTSTLIGPTGGDSIEGGLTFDPSTGLFFSMWQTGVGDSQELITIDPATGLGTIIGNMGLDAFSDVSGLSLRSDGTLFGYDPATSGPSDLLELDPVTGLATIIGDIGDILLSSGVGGLAYDADTDTLYMSNAAELWTIDPTTGVGTLIGSHGIADLITCLTVLPDTEPTCMLAIDQTSVLWDLDPLTGAGSNPRVTTESKFGGLAISGTGELFGTRSAPIPELYSIDPPTGIATLIGPLGIPHSEGGLDFDPTSGVLFGVGGVSELFEVDTTTGAATIVGALEDEFGDPIDPSAIAFDDVGMLFVLKAASVPPEIYAVDPADASVLARVPLVGLPLAFTGGMDFDDTTGTLHMVYGDMLYDVNPTSGATTLLGPTPLLVTALEITGACDPPPAPPRVRPARPVRWRPPPGG